VFGGMLNLALSIYPVPLNWSIKS